MGKQVERYEGLDLGRRVEQMKAYSVYLYEKKGLIISCLWCWKKALDGNQLPGTLCNEPVRLAERFVFGVLRGRA